MYSHAGLGNAVLAIGHPGPSCDFGKLPFSIVAKKQVGLPAIGYVDVYIPICVKVHEDYAKGRQGPGANPCGEADIRESAIALVAVEPVRLSGGISGTAENVKALVQTLTTASRQSSQVELEVIGYVETQESICIQVPESCARTPACIGYPSFFCDLGKMSVPVVSVE